MGVILAYSTTHPVPPDLAAEILEQAEIDVPDRLWTLCEPPRLDPELDHGLLTGWSKLFLLPDVRNRDDPDEIGPNETHDLRILLEVLCRWSERFHLTWELSIEGSLLGRIVHGACDERVWDALDSLADVACEFGEAHPWEYEEDIAASRPRLRIWPEPD